MWHPFIGYCCQRAQFLAQSKTGHGDKGKLLSETILCNTINARDQKKRIRNFRNRNKLRFGQKCPKVTSVRRVWLC